jgi:hypothetical protein
MHVYHFTDTARLPWILKDGWLRPSDNHVIYPRDFLWATTDERGSRSSSVLAPKTKGAYCDGRVALVRFTLASEAFIPWPMILDAYPEWTESHRLLLEKTARQMGDTAIENWRCRAEPIGLSCVIAVHAKAYVGAWKKLESPASVRVSGHPDVLGVRIGGRSYFSRQKSLGYKLKGYELVQQIG